jgi:hypothetical protein
MSKDESKYLKEWIVYHKLIGINNFIIYLHNNSDDSYDLINNIKEKIDVNISLRVASTESVDWKIKNVMFNKIIDEVNTEFFCCLDIDEFIVLPQSDHIEEILNLSMFDGFGGIAVYQDIFGSNGHIESPNGLVIENYTKRNPDKIDLHAGYPDYTKPEDLYKHIKTIVRKKFYINVLDSHEYETEFPVIDENDELYRSYDVKRPTSKIKINHYFTKSLEDWRFKTGRPRFSGQPTYPDSWFDYFNSFDYYDNFINEKYSDKIKKLL